MAHMSKVLLTIILAIVADGCTSRTDYRLRFVDESTGQPLDGVLVRAYLWGHYNNNRLFPAKGKVSAPPSSANGETTLHLVSGHGLSYYLFVERNGYSALTGDTSPSQGCWYLAYHERDTLPSPTRETAIVNATPAAPVMIGMRKLVHLPLPRN